MSFTPMYDPNSNMLPSPNRGKRNPRFSSNSPRQPFSPGFGQNSYSPQQSPYSNRSRTPNRGSQGRGRGCQFGGYQRDVQQFSPNYRSMTGSYEGSSPNCSFESNQQRRFQSNNALYHPSMLRDPWEDISSEDKPIFKAANYISENFMSYCAKLQTKVRDYREEEKDVTTSVFESYAKSFVKSYDRDRSRQGSSSICSGLNLNESRPSKMLKTEPAIIPAVEKAETSENTSKSQGGGSKADSGNSNVKAGDNAGNEDDLSDDEGGNIMF